jgi:hypothetical protein
MASTEAGPKIVDLVTAELVECQPDAADLRVAVAVEAVPLEASPTQQAAQATIEQTGADPPPSGSR